MSKIEFTEKELETLSNEIARLCEKQYRKGVQQGIELGLKKEQACDFRYHDHDNIKSAYSIHKSLQGFMMSRAEFIRLMQIECSDFSYNEDEKSLSSILLKFENPLNP